MNRSLATAKRVLHQLAHDKRTLLLVWLVPVLLMTLLRFVFDKNLPLFGRVAPVLLGIFPMITMFLITSIAMLRERRSGTLDRLMTMPINKGSLIAGYALAFALVALVQAVIASFVAIKFLDVEVAAGVPLLVSAAITSALLGTAMGLFLSAFAKSEFQAVQFLPAFILPQLLVCGLLVPREQMAMVLQRFADFVPMTYAVDAMQQITVRGSLTNQMVRDFLILGGFILVALILGALTIRRQD